MISLGALVRAHRRSLTLDIALSELKRYGTMADIQTWICIQVDRPTPEVSEVLARHVGPQCHIVEAPGPALSTKENFLRNLNAHLAALERFHPNLDWIYLADDDRWFEPQRISSELPSALCHHDAALLDARSCFMWDRPTQYNALRHHVSPVLWRHQPKQRWSGKRMIQAPDALHDHYILTGRHAHLKTPLLDYGSYTAEERHLLHSTFAAAGKVDAYTDSLLAPPQLATFPDDSAPWTDLFSQWTDKTPSA